MEKHKRSDGVECVKNAKTHPEQKFIEKKWKRRPRIRWCETVEVEFRIAEIRD